MKGRMGWGLWVRGALWWMEQEVSDEVRNHNKVEVEVEVVERSWAVESRCRR